MSDKLAAALHGSTPADDARRNSPTPHRVHQVVKQLAEGLPTDPLVACGTGISRGDHWYVAKVVGEFGLTVVADIASNDGENEAERNPYARLFAEAPKLRAAVDAVLEKHQPGDFHTGLLCLCCDQPYPCPTVNVITAAFA